MSLKNEKARIAESYNKLYHQFSSTNITDVGNYSIIKLIGEGAFGKVYLANHKLTHTKVVLKTGSKDDPNLVREVFYHRQFKHPNITRLYEVVLTEGMIWMVLEYCPNGELYERVLSSRRIPVDETKKLFAQIVSAVYYAHSLNCIHRDLKLENILLDKKNNAKLSDFGFTRECEHRSLLETVCGTTVYMAPELIQKTKYDGFKVDIWSLGIILYTMLYGQMPFDDDDEVKTQFIIVNEEPEYSNDIPQDAINLIKKLLSKTPNDRPSTQDILNDPFLEQEGQFQLEASDNLLKNLKSNKAFSTKTEKHLLKKLKSLGIDVHALQKSVSQRNCDSLSGLWELLLEKQKKKEAKKYKTRSRSVLRITESTSRRVSQLIEPITTPQLSRIVSYKSNITNANLSTVEKSNNNSNSPNTNSITFSNYNIEDSSKTSSPEKKKNGFIQKFTKFWKINKRDDMLPSSSSFLHSHENGNHHTLHNQRSFSESHAYPGNNINGDSYYQGKGHSQSVSLQPPLNLNVPKTQNDNNKKQLQLDSSSLHNQIKQYQQQKQSSGVQLKIKEPKSPLRSTYLSTNTPSSRGRSNRPISLISQHSYNSQLTTMSDISLDSNTTTQSDITTRPAFTRKISSDASLQSRNATRRSLSLISSNSSASERSSRRNSLYDNSSSDLKFTTISIPRGRKYNENAIFPRAGGFRRKKSPLGGLPPNSKYRRSKPLVIEEDEEEVDDGEVDEGEDDELGELSTDIEHMELAESTRKSSDFEDDLSLLNNKSS